MELGVDPLPRAAGTAAAWHASMRRGALLLGRALLHVHSRKTPAQENKEKAASNCIQRHFFKPVNLTHTWLPGRSGPLVPWGLESPWKPRLLSGPCEALQPQSAPFRGWWVSRTFPTTRETAVRPREWQVPVWGRPQVGRQHIRAGCGGPCSHRCQLPSATSRTACPSHKATAAVKWGT